MPATRSVVVVHRERMLAEAIASALARYPSIHASASTSAAAVPADRPVDAVALDAGLSGADRWAARLRGRGIRVVMLGRNVEADGGVAVETREPVSALAVALIPEIGQVDRRRPRLTTREGQVLSLVARGMAGKQVATQLGISPKTVEGHKTRIFEKLGVANQAAAVGVALASREIEGPIAWM